jgi:FkbM family methyltransferase
MKLKHLPRALGLPSVVREYPFGVSTFHLPAEGDVQLAVWQHPNERPKTVTQASIDALRTFLRPGDVAIDVGAHTGDSTVPIALAVGPAGTVYALEPNPYVFKVLAANAGLNQSKTHIVPLMFAAMPEDGEFEFAYSDHGFCNGGVSTWLHRWTNGHFWNLRVAGRNLLAYLQAEAPHDLARIRYIKLDTEGFDRAVFASLAGIVGRCRPYIKTEIYRHLPEAERFGYYDDLRRAGYRVFLCEDEDRRGPELARAAMTERPHFDVFGVPD